MVCAICGVNEATTRDHIPPRCIFPTPRPNNLVTVPACPGCNNGASDLDDLFKVYLSFQAAESNDLARELLLERTTRTLEHNQRLLNQLREDLTEIEVPGEDGIPRSATGVLWCSEAHDAVIERVLRGLYYVHSGEIPIPTDAEVKVQWLNGVPGELAHILPMLTTVTIEEDQFTYKYIIAEDDPRYSTWVFDFYGAHWASGYTQPATTS